MQLKQTYSKYYGQIDEEMKRTLTENPEFERAHQEKDVLCENIWFYALYTVQYYGIQVSKYFGISN